jgi:hypothetical protein
MLLAVGVAAVTLTPQFTRRGLRAWRWVACLLSPAIAGVVDDRSTARYAWLVTAKEKLLELAPHWSEEQAVRALRAAEGVEAADDWGKASAGQEVAYALTSREEQQSPLTAGSCHRSSALMIL